MRTKIWKTLVLFFIAGVSDGFAQGTLVFANRVSGLIDAPIYDSDCKTLLRGNAFIAQLYAGPRGSSAPALVPVGVPLPFYRTDPAAGYLDVTAGPNTVVIPFVPPGQHAAVQMRVWESAAGSFENAVAGGYRYGASKVLTISLSGIVPAVGSHAYLIGLQSFCLVPEPSAVALSVLGLWLLGWASRKGPRFW